MPLDTDERHYLYFSEEFRQDPSLRWSIEPAVPTFHGRDARQFMPARGSFPWQVERAPQAVLYEEVPIFNDMSTPGRRSFYGNYVGPMNEFEPGKEPPPLTPVDKAAWLHDREYLDIYERYGYSEFEYGLSFSREVDKLFGSSLSANENAVMMFGWLGQANSLDPGMQLELAWADLKIIGRSWLYIGEGFGSGFYSGGRGQRALISDVAWGTAITGFHAALILWRLTVMVPAGLAYQIARGFTGAISGLGKAIGGDVGGVITWAGDALDRIVVGAGQVFTGITTFASAVYLGVAGLAAGVLGGVVYVGGKIVEGVGNVIKEVGKAVGCFITTATVTVTGQSDGGEILSILRAFRDEYMVTVPGGRRLISTYYEVAPRIVSAINHRSDRQSVWEGVYTRWVAPAAAAVLSGDNRSAVAIYTDMMVDLSTLAGVPLKFDGGRFDVKSDPRMWY